MYGEDGMPHAIDVRTGGVIPPPHGAAYGGEAFNAFPGASSANWAAGSASPYHHPGGGGGGGGYYTPWPSNHYASPDTAPSWYPRQHSNPYPSSNPYPPSHYTPYSATPAGSWGGTTPHSWEPMTPPSESSPYQHHHRQQHSGGGGGHGGGGHENSTLGQPVGSSPWFNGGNAALGGPGFGHGHGNGHGHRGGGGRGGEEREWGEWPEYEGHGGRGLSRRPSTKRRASPHHRIPIDDDDDGGEEEGFGHGLRRTMSHGPPPLGFGGGGGFGEGHQDRGRDMLPLRRTQSSNPHPSPHHSSRSLSLNRGLGFTRGAGRSRSRTRRTSGNLQPFSPYLQPTEEYSMRNLARRPLDWRADYDPRAGLASYIPRVPRPKSDVIDFTDDDRRSAHTLLTYKPRHTPIYLDLRYPPHETLAFPLLSRLPNPLDFAQLATLPPTPQMRLFHPLLPWYIDILQRQPNGITVGQVVEEMVAQLGVPILGRHWFNEELGEEVRAKMGRGWEERTRGDEGERERGVKRVDFLRGRVVFEGLVRTRGGLWEMKTRKHE